MVNFAYTGAVQNYVVPAGVTQVVIETVGAEGGFRKIAAWEPSSGSTRGGAGAYMRSVHSVTPGETLSVYVGGSPNAQSTDALRSFGGYNGGGSSVYDGVGGRGPSDAGGGGTDVRRGGTALSNRICAAGGGGGNGYLAALIMGGNASVGGGVGGNGGGGSLPGYSVTGGRGGAPLAGGAGGTSSPEGAVGGAGVLGVGGHGGAILATGIGAGGGGGLYGGGGGGGLGSDLSAGGGGGGGSTGVLTGANRTLSSVSAYNFTGSPNAVTSGHGRATINPYTPPTPIVTGVTDVTTKTTPVITVNVTDLHPSATGQRNFTYELSQSSAFATDVISVTISLPAGFTAGAFQASLPKQGLWYLRVKASGDGGMSDSPWSTTQSITTSHIPSSSITGPTSDSYVIWNTTTKFSFTTTDSASGSGDTVSAYQILFERNNDGSFVKDTGKVALAEPFGSHAVDVALETEFRDSRLRWRVRVWDSTDTAGPWSSYGLFTLTLPPAVTIVNPTAGGTVDTGAPTIAWTSVLSGGRTQKQASVTVTQVSTGQVVWVGNVSGASTAITPASTVLINDTDYVVRVRVTDTFDLFGEASHTFKTAYVSPNPVSYYADDSLIEDFGHVLIDWSATNADSSIVAWNIYRRVLPGTNWDLLVTINDSSQRTYKDFMVRSGVTYMYNVTQLADRSGALLESPVGSRLKSYIAPTIKNLITNPSMEATSGTVEVRRNLMLNPRGTNPGSLTGFVLAPQWYGSGGVGTTTYVTGASDGPEVSPGVKVDSYGRKTWTTVGGGGGVIGWALTAGARPAVSAGTIHMASLYWRNSSGASTGINRIDAEFYDAASGGNKIGATLNGPQFDTPAAGQWQRVSGTFTVPAGATHVAYVLRVDMSPGSITVGMTLDASAALVEVSPVVLPYFDHLYSPDSDLTPSATGAANASPSVLTGVGVTGTEATGGTKRAYVSTQWVGKGGRSLRITPASASLDSNSAVGGNSTSAMNAGLAAGKKFTILGTVRLSAPLAGPRNPASLCVELVYNTVPGWTGATYLRSSPAPNLAGDHEVRGTFDIPANATWAMIRLFNGAAAGGGDVWWDNVALVEGEYTGQYFDGSNRPAFPTGFAVRWLGAANASVSELYEPPFIPEDRVNEIISTQYWIIAPDAPHLTMIIPSVTSATMTEEYESATFTIIGRGRHRDYGDRLGYTGSLEFQVRKPEYPSTVRQNVERLRREQETYFLRTPFGLMFSVALGDPGWTPMPGVGMVEMGDMTLPFEEVN